MQKLDDENSIDIIFTSYKLEIIL